MAQVNIEIAGRSYQLGCRDGEEAHLRALGRIVDAKASDAVRAMGPMTESRQLLVTALLLADSVTDQQPVSAESDTRWAADAIERLAARVEKLALRLEDRD